VKDKFYRFESLPELPDVLNGMIVTLLGAPDSPGRSPIFSAVFEGGAGGGVPSHPTANIPMTIIKVNLTTFIFDFFAPKLSLIPT